MPIQNSYDIYNSTFNTDKSTVDIIVNEILTLLETNIAAEINSFDYSLLTHLPIETPLLKSNRIIDRVLCILRDKGIRATVKNNPLSPTPDSSLSTPYYTPWFNGLAYYNTITIKWFSRNSSEFMKNYI